MKRILALLASTALLLPASPAGAWGMPELPGSDSEPGLGPGSGQQTSVRITNCSKTRHGTTVRIRIRDEGRRGLVRVSHPRGDGKFREPRVRSVYASMGWAGEAPPPGPNGEQLGGGVMRQGYGDRASFRTRTPNYGTTSAYATFKLRGGKSIRLECTMR